MYTCWYQNRQNVGNIRCMLRIHDTGKYVIKLITYILPVLIPASIHWELLHEARFY